MEISRSEAGFFHVAYAVKNSRGLSTGFHLLPKDSTQHTRDMNELCPTRTLVSRIPILATQCRSRPSSVHSFSLRHRPRRIGSARLTQEKADWNFKRVTVLAQIQTLRFKLSPWAPWFCFGAPQVSFSAAHDQRSPTDPLLVGLLFVSVGLLFVSVGVLFVPAVGLTPPRYPVSVALFGVLCFSRFPRCCQSSSARCVRRLLLRQSSLNRCSRQVLLRQSVFAR